MVGELIPQTFKLFPWRDGSHQNTIFINNYITDNEKSRISVYNSFIPEINCRAKIFKNAYIVQLF